MSNLLLCCGYPGMHLWDKFQKWNFCAKGYMLCNLDKYCQMVLHGGCSVLHSQKQLFFSQSVREWMVYCSGYSLHFSLCARDVHILSHVKAFCSCFFCEMSVPIFILGCWLFSQFLEILVYYGDSHFICNIRCRFFPQFLTCL